MTLKREFCCSECGLIWFSENTTVNGTVCPECNANQGIYACDTFGYAYAIEGIVNDLKERGKEIHYSKEHPYHNKTK